MCIVAYASNASATMILFTKNCHAVTYCANEFECASSNLTDYQISCHDFASCIDAHSIIAKWYFTSQRTYGTYGATSVTSGVSSCNGD